MSIFDAGVFDVGAFDAGVVSDTGGDSALQSGAHGYKRGRTLQEFLDGLAEERRPAEAPKPAPSPAPKPEPQPEPQPIAARIEWKRQPKPDRSAERAAVQAQIIADAARIAQAQRDAEEALRRALEEDEDDVLMLLAA